MSDETEEAKKARFEDARRLGAPYVHIYRCPGYAINGSLKPGCHPDEEPNSGYDVLLGAIMLNQKPMPLEEAKQYATYVGFWIGYAMQDALANKKREMWTPIHDLTPEHFEQRDPGMTQIPILRAMAEHGGVLRPAAVSPSRCFEVDLPRGLLVPWDELMWLERAGYVLRVPGTPRDTGTRTITELGRKALQNLPKKDA